MTLYPSKIDNNTSLPDVINLVTDVDASVFNRLKAAILAIEVELGVKPSGVYTTVKSRLDLIETLVGGPGGSPLIQLTGDFGGITSAPLVVGLQGVPVAPTVPTDGYLLTYVSSATQWQPRPAPISLILPAEIVLVAGVFGVGISTFTRIGGRKIDLTNYPASVGSKTRSIKFIADVDKTPGATSIEIQLFDRTDNIVITGTDLTSTSTATAGLVSANLTVGSSAGNLRSDTAKFYEVQMKMNGGVPGTDQVFCENARLLITYA